MSVSVRVVALSSAATETRRRQLIVQALAPYSCRLPRLRRACPSAALDERVPHYHHTGSRSQVFGFGLSCFAHADDSGSPPVADSTEVGFWGGYEALNLPPMSESSTVLVSVHGPDHLGIAAGMPLSVGCIVGVRPKLELLRDGARPEARS